MAATRVGDVDPQLIAVWISHLHPKLSHRLIQPSWFFQSSRILERPLKPQLHQVLLDCLREAVGKVR
jgi:hypothetical protein